MRLAGEGLPAGVEIRVPLAGALLLLEAEAKGLRG